MVCKYIDVKDMKKSSRVAGKRQVETAQLVHERQLAERRERDRARRQAKRTAVNVETLNCCWSLV